MEQVDETSNKLKEIDKHIRKNEWFKSFELCLDNNLSSLIHLLFSSKVYIRVKLLCNWTTSKELCGLWKKMSKNGLGTWDRLLVTDEDFHIDYYVIINKPQPGSFFIKEKTIIFQMEPHMKDKPDIWGEYSNPQGFLKIIGPPTDINNNEWHLSLNYIQLSTLTIEKKYDKVISAILSSKYIDPGHIKRLDLAEYIDKNIDPNIEFHVYGENSRDFINYKGSLPYHNKDNGILPYKYHLTAENHSIPNYYTEKLIDCILGECLCFYWGPKNIRYLIDDRAFIWLDMDDYAHDLQIIQTCINQNLWEHRLPYIKKEKQRILNELQFFPRLSKLLS